MEASNYDVLEDLIDEINKELQHEFQDPPTISQSQLKKLKRWDRNPESIRWENTDKRLRLYIGVDGVFIHELAIQWR